MDRIERTRTLTHFGWTLNERNIEPDGTGYIEFSDLSNQSSINIGNTYEKISLKGIARITIEEFRKSTEDFRLVDEGQLTINGRDAYDIFLTYKHPSKGIVQNEYIFIKSDNRLYSFSLQDTASLGEYIKMASIMLNMVYSAEFIDSGKEDQFEQDGSHSLILREYEKIIPFNR